MRKFILAAMMAMTAAPVLVAADPAIAQDRRDWRDDQRGNDRRGNDRRDDRRNDRQADWREARRYDWNRPDPRYGKRYDAARYYRNDTSYRERRLTRNDRIYRGNDGRYYCRRQDGTTGLIVGALAGGVLGNTISNGNSSTLATLLGAAGGGLLGRSIDRGEARCR